MVDMLPVWGFQSGEGKIPFPTPQNGLVLYDPFDTGSQPNGSLPICHADPAALGICNADDHGRAGRNPGTYQLGPFACASFWQHTSYGQDRVHLFRQPDRSDLPYEP